MPVVKVQVPIIRVVRSPNLGLRWRHIRCRWRMMFVSSKRTSHIPPPPNTPTSCAHTGSLTGFSSRSTKRSTAYTRHVSTEIHALESNDLRRTAHENRHERQQGVAPPDAQGGVHRRREEREAEAEGGRVSIALVVESNARMSCKRARNRRTSARALVVQANAPLTQPMISKTRPPRGRTPHAA